jgi:hypothetical protein
MTESVAIMDWGIAFRAEATRNIPSVSVVLSERFIGSSSRINRFGTSHWLTRLMTVPAASAGLGALDVANRRKIA